MTSDLTTAKKPFTFWPYAIVLTFVLFAGYIGWFVYQAMTLNVDLVSNDYYQKELAFQQHINSVNRTASLAGTVELSHNQTGKILDVTLPNDFAGKTITGSVQFFRPSDSSMDFDVPLQLSNGQLHQQLSTAKLKPGFWKIRLNFEAASEPYFAELPVTIK